MARSTWLADVVNDEFRSDRDVEIVVRDGWKTRSAEITTVDHVAIMDHDTGSQEDSKYANVRNWVEYGSGIAPLCNIIGGAPGYGGLSKFRIDIIAAGRTNHGGKPDDTWDSFDSWLTNQANKLCIGLEWFWIPGMSWSDEFIEIQMRTGAALLAHMGKDASGQVDHKDYATLRKQDRRLIPDTGAYRRALQPMIDARSNEEDIMPSIEEIRAVVREEARAAVEERWADRRFRNWVDGQIEPMRVTIHSIRRDSAAGRVAAEAARAFARAAAERSGLSTVDLAHIEAIVEDTIAGGIKITGSITAGDPEGGTP